MRGYAYCFRWLKVAEYWIRTGNNAAVVAVVVAVVVVATV